MILKGVKEMLGFGLVCNKDPKELDPGNSPKSYNFLKKISTTRDGKEDVKNIIKSG
jgi:hypothetical protein